MLSAGAKTRYVCMLVLGKVLRQFDVFSVELVINTIEHLNLIIFCLGAYFFLLIRCQRKIAQCAAK